MSIQVSPRETMRQRLELLYAPVAADMQEAEQLLARELTSEYPFVDQLVRHCQHLGGKRLRPALVLLAAKAVGQVTSDHLTMAAVLEMIHTATLVHDDVLDEADLRRHRQTINARFSNETSVLLGDYLFTHAFYMASTLETTFGCQTIGKATNKVCEGELRQIESRGNFQLTEEEYLQIIDAKTAELCACSCKLGAHYAGGSRAVVQTMTRFGRDLGIAFQIADDLLDLIGDEQTAGKSLGTDLQKQKMTLPLIRLLSLATADERTNLIALLSDSRQSRREVLLPRLEQTGSLEYARSRAQHYAQTAATHLSTLPDTPARDTLRQLTEFVVLRRS